MKAPKEKILKYNDMKKWDVIVANPPFNLGEKMLTKWFDLADTICTVQPSTWLLGKKKTKSICSHLDSSEFTADIESINGSEFFDAGISGVMAVQFFEKNITNHNTCNIVFDGKQYTKTDDISLTSNDELLNEFKRIVEPIYLNKNIESIMCLDHKLLPNMGINRLLEYNPNPNWWCMGIQLLRGNKNKHTGEPKDDFYTIISNNNAVINRKTGLYKNIHEEEIPNRTVENNQKFNFQFYIHADTKIELDNITNYLKTDFCRGCLRLIKTSTNLMAGELKYIPWFDFSDPVFSKSPSEIDDYLFAKYNISDEIRKHIEELLPDYYSIRK